MTLDGEVQYARTPEGHLAYVVDGAGPHNLLLLSGWLIPIEAMPDEPGYDHLLRRLGSFARVARFDWRGVGLSDPVATDASPTLEQWVADARAVLAESDMRTATVISLEAISGYVAALLGATCPEMISGLVMMHATARLRWAPDYPIGRRAEQTESPERVEGGWGTTWGLEALAPSVADNDRFLRWWNTSRRRGASPTTARNLLTLMLDTDIRGILEAVHVPTLVLHRSGNEFSQIAHGRFVADGIPNARFRELPGIDHLPYVGDVDAVADAIEEFVTGRGPAPSTTRALAAVLFTDIVKSTEHATAVGDARWRITLDTHDALVRRELDRTGGREVKTTGDGFLAVFDGPGHAIDCALAITSQARRLGVEVRAGIHVGEIEHRRDDISGVAVHAAHRVAEVARSGEVLVSRTVVDLVAGTHFTFEERGAHKLKGLAGEWALFAAVL